MPAEIEQIVSEFQSSSLTQLQHSSFAGGGV